MTILSHVRPPYLHRPGRHKVYKQMNLYQISQPKFNFNNIDDGFILLLIDCARMDFFHSLFKLFNTPMEASACYFHFVFFCQVGMGVAVGRTETVKSAMFIIVVYLSIAGDTSQDLKTGYLLGATPKKQQIGELIGVLASGLAIGGVLYLLNTAWGYGSAEVPAPQATLMKMIVEGIMGGKLPWTLVFIGVFLAIGLEILRIPVMPFAIGLYLPIYLNATIMIGGVVRMFVDRRKNVDDKKKEEQATDGTLYCAGMIAGEGLVGILLAILAVVNVSSVFDLSGSINLGNAGGVILMLLMILSLLKFSIWNKKKA